MAKICVVGGTELKGNVRVAGAKNAILPILAATLLTTEPVIIEDCPRLTDVENMLSILCHMGSKYWWDGEVLTVDSSAVSKWEMPESLAKELRSSIFMLGPVVGRFKMARLTYPGGCEIGNRPIDLHLKGFAELNVDIKEEAGYINCNAADMRGADIHLDYPSVGATENIMMAAICAKGTTIIRNAAREPEITELQNFLVKMGAKLYGAGSSTIVIEGGGMLKGVRHRLLPDRIVAGTYMVAAAISAGDITVENVRPDHLSSVFAKLKECGCRLSIGENWVRTVGPKRPEEMRLIETLPYPGFPTDMQAQFFALATVANGTSIIAENVFENRFKHAGELSRMGAIVTIKDRMAIIRGIPRLSGAEVTSRDLRGGAALVLGGLRAEGLTRIDAAHYIDRGYERFEDALKSLGANIYREQ